MRQYMMTIRQMENYSAAPLDFIETAPCGYSDAKASQVETSEHLCWNDCMVVSIGQVDHVFLHIIRRNYWHFLFKTFLVADFDGVKFAFPSTVPKSWQIHSYWIMCGCGRCRAVSIWVGFLATPLHLQCAGIGICSWTRDLILVSASAVSNTKLLLQKQVVFTISQWIVSDCCKHEPWIARMYQISSPRRSAMCCCSITVEGTSLSAPGLIFVWKADDCT